MYESDFGTDWTSLSHKAAVARAFALGVAASFGEDDSREYERIVDQMETAYDRSLVALAYQEGRTKARKHEADESDEVWSDLVLDESAEPADIEVDVDARPSEGVPGSVTRIDLLDRPGDDLGRIRLPDFLSR